MFYDTFKSLCKKNNKTPTGVGVELGINRGTVSYWKTEGKTPNLQTLSKIANYFNVSVTELLGEKKEPPESDPLTDEVIKLAKSLSEESLTKLIDYAQLLLNAEQNQ